VALQKNYFTQPWNIFDLCMVFISFIDILSDIMLEEGGWSFRVFRLVSYCVTFCREFMVVNAIG